MTNDDKIRDEKLDVILIEKQQKYQDYHSKKLINVNLLQVMKCYLLIKEERQNKLSLLILLLGKAFEKQIKTIEYQVEKQIKRLKNMGNNQ